MLFFFVEVLIYIILLGSLLCAYFLFSAIANPHTRLLLSPSLVGFFGFVISFFFASFPGVSCDGG